MTYHDSIILMLSKSKLKGGDKLRFSDIVTCVASMAVIMVLIAAPLEMVFVSALGLALGYPISLAVTLFLTALISGYIFAGKIWEARREAITKITVLWAAFGMVLVGIGSATIADLGPMVKEGYQGQYGTTLSTSEWVNLESMNYDGFIFLTVGMVLVLGFIGLYVGSMLRKPKKS